MILDEKVILDDAENYSSKKELVQVLMFIFVLAENNFLNNEDRILDLVNKMVLKPGNGDSLRSISKNLAHAQRYEPVSLFKYCLTQSLSRESHDDNVLSSSDEELVKVLSFFFRNVTVSKHEI